ncbi:MAG: GntR family transcriptional regulator [Sphaerochaetaceae bacterium]|jgi:GntR family transcriptional regulator of arabinose operon|nr:GntR family transcriptional regulator [Sphaerochaetaceae bacterium]MDD4762515.1 GntR family transcriptional regulator [Sphaerochaetaceae bacterium]MDD4841712.1 GntR family transcriptional regulator [Sphaerochaetaceae bacterium]MDX9933851.1 GntR family transcriptional regulator [Sphaerochaetaceae bacterium]
MSKYSDIAVLLREEIQRGSYNDKGKLPTEHELVKRFGVSRQTIRQAISCLKHEGHLYQIQGSGTYISSSKVKKPQLSSKTIVTVSTYISNYIFPEIIRGMERELSSEGFNINLIQTENRVDKERTILEKIINDGNAAGIIVEGTKTALPNPNISLYRKIKEMGIPLVFLHSTYPELSDEVVVGMDDFQGGKELVKYLVKKGHTTIGGIFKSDDRQGLFRYAGFSEGLLTSGLGLNDARVRWYTTEDYCKHHKLIEANNEVFDILCGLTAVVCYNDEIAVWISRACKAASMPIPEIVSFDSSQYAMLLDKPFVSIGHRKELLGKTAAKKIINMIEGGHEESILMDWDTAVLKANH